MKTLASKENHLSINANSLGDSSLVFLVVQAQVSCPLQYESSIICVPSTCCVGHPEPSANELWFKEGASHTAYRRTRRYASRFLS